MKTAFLLGDVSGANMRGWQTTDAGVRYVFQAGDTLGALANKYLGAWSRQGEIWMIQSAVFKALRRTPSNIKPGDVLTMPVEAVRLSTSLELVPRAPPKKQKTLLPATVENARAAVAPSDRWLFSALGAVAGVCIVCIAYAAYGGTR